MSDSMKNLQEEIGDIDDNMKSLADDDQKNLQEEISSIDSNIKSVEGQLKSLVVEMKSCKEELKQLEKEHENMERQNIPLRQRTKKIKQKFDAKVDEVKEHEHKILILNFILTTAVYVPLYLFPLLFDWWQVIWFYLGSCMTINCLFGEDKKEWWLLILQKRDYSKYTQSIAQELDKLKPDWEKYESQKDDYHCRKLLADKKSRDLKYKEDKLNAKLDELKRDKKKLEGDNTLEHTHKKMDLATSRSNLCLRLNILIFAALMALHKWNGCCALTYWPWFGVPLLCFALTTIDDLRSMISKIRRRNDTTVSN